MRNPPSILICAGEVSGDMLGAELMCELRTFLPEVAFSGIGGSAMQKEGLHVLGGLEEFPGMGLMEVLPAIPRLLRLRQRVVAWAQENKPDICITIDNQEFSRRVAAKVSLLGIPCVQYAAPKVWAWRQGRVHALKRIFSHILCLFPFEAEFFTRHGLPATYIGHPVVKRMAELPKAKAEVAEKLVLALLPGSRRSELIRHWPVFLATLRLLRRQLPELTGLVVVESKATLGLLKEIGWEKGLRTVVGDDRFKALAGCTAALTKSGTNNLELALLHVPAVVAYIMNPLTYLIATWLVKVPFVSPPNLVLGKAVYPEMIQKAAVPSGLAAAVLPLLRDSAGRRNQIQELDNVAEALATNVSPVEAAARVVVEMLRV